MLRKTENDNGISYRCRCSEDDKQHGPDLFWMMGTGGMEKCGGHSFMPAGNPHTAERSFGSTACIV